MTKTLTFDALTDLEPRLGALERLCRLAAPAAHGDPDYEVWGRAVKPLLLPLVGWSRGDLDVRKTLAKPELLEDMVIGLFDEEVTESVARQHARAASTEVEAVLCSSEAYDIAYQHLCKVIGGEA